MSQTLDSGTVFGGHVAAFFPVTYSRLDNADPVRQKPDAARGLDRFFQRPHRVLQKHECDITNNTNVIQVSCLITDVKSDKPDLNTFGGRLTYARELRGLTQKQLAIRCGMSQGSIGNYESSARSTSRKIVKIAAELNVRVQWLVHHDGPMEIESGDASDGTPQPAMASNEMIRTAYRDDDGNIHVVFSSDQRRLLSALHAADSTEDAKLRERLKKILLDAAETVHEFAPQTDYQLPATIPAGAKMFDSLDRTPGSKKGGSKKRKRRK